MTSSWVEIQKDAFEHNVTQLAAALGVVGLAVVIKGNAYGHGTVPVGMLVQENAHISFVVTSCVADAVTLRLSGFSKPLCSYLTYDCDLSCANDHGIDLVCFDDCWLERILNEFKKRPVRCGVHVKINTGMNRFGFSAECVPMVIKKLHNAGIPFLGLMTHMADSRDPDSSFTGEQVARFNECVATEGAAPKNVVTHACSSGSWHHARGHSHVRVASHVFGIYKSDQQRLFLQKKYPDFFLKPVLFWKTRIASFTRVRTGETIGYGRTFRANRPMRVAVLPVGYFEGYPRGITQGLVGIKNTMVPIVGSIAMNSMVCDVTDVPHAQVGDEVVLFGGSEELSPDVIAKKTGTINLDIITKILPSITRIIV